MSRKRSLSRGFCIRGPQDFTNIFAVSHETLEKLEVYAGLLIEWQKIKNLVAPNTLNDIWHRHFADSAQLFSLAPEAKIWLDIGSGAGFPGLVLAILLSEKTKTLVHLVESNSRKCAFLHEVVRKTGLIVEIHDQRIETLAESDKVIPADVVTARALAPLEKLFGLAVPFFDSGTTGLFLKGREVTREMEAAKRHWCFNWDIIPSRTDPEGCVIEVKTLRPV